MYHLLSQKHDMIKFIDACNILSGIPVSVVVIVVVVISSVALSNPFRIVSHRDYITTQMT